ncbi:unnamed protein product, partial [Larinioides sclopetarius]
KLDSRSCIRWRVSFHVFNIRHCLLVILSYFYEFRSDLTGFFKTFYRNLPCFIFNSIN